MTEFTIRPYQVRDRQDFMRIAADTAFFGEPVEAYLEDRGLFCEAFYAYYTDFEPEHAWVACAGDELAGFLAGCTDTRRHDSRWLREILPNVAKRVLTGSFRTGRLTTRYTWSLILAGLRREFPQVNLKIYPAHLHINVDAAWRGNGLGQRLIETYLDQLRSLHIPGVHLHTTSLNEAACRLYEKTGFSLLEAVKTSLWTYWGHPSVELRCYGQRLTT